MRHIARVFSIIQCSRLLLFLSIKCLVIGNFIQGRILRKKRKKERSDRRKEDARHLPAKFSRLSWLVLRKFSHIKKLVLNCKPQVIITCQNSINYRFKSAIMNDISVYHTVVLYIFYQSPDIWTPADLVDIFQFL